MKNADGTDMTVEQLQAKIDSQNATLTEQGEKIDGLGTQISERDSQIQGLSTERDGYRTQVQTLNADADGGDGEPQYVTATQHKLDLQAAVNNAYSAANGNMMLMREIDRTIAVYKPLSDWNSDLSKRTAIVLQKERFGVPLTDPKTGRQVTPNSWDDYIYKEINVLSTAVQIAEGQLLKEEKVAVDEKIKADAAGRGGQMISGGGDAGGGSGGSEKEWNDAADKGDIGSMEKMIGQHLENKTGQPVNE